MYWNNFCQTYQVDISVLQVWLLKPTTRAATAMHACMHGMMRESILTLMLTDQESVVNWSNQWYVPELYLFMILNLYLFLYENISEIIMSLVTLCTNIMIHVAGAKIIRDIKNSQNAKQRKNSGLVWQFALSHWGDEDGHVDKFKIKSKLNCLVNYFDSVIYWYWVHSHTGFLLLYSFLVFRICLNVAKCIKQTTQCWKHSTVLKLYISTIYQMCVAHLKFSTTSVEGRL